MSHVLRRAAPALVFALLLGACTGGGTATPRPAGSSSTRIVEAELEPLLQISAYEAIQRLRARWLQSRTGQPPAVHLDGNLQSGGMERLRSLRAFEIQELEYMSPADATTRYGTGYPNGLILVTTKR